MGPFRVVGPAFSLPWLGLIGLVAAGCASGPAASPATVEAPVAAPSSASADEQKRRGEIDAIFEWATPGQPGCALAVSRNGKPVVSAAYGSADLERNVPVVPDTVFDAGSLQKQFVAASVLLLVQGGRLSLADDVRKHIPELPDYGETITLNHLLTHTSGVRDWTGLLPLAADKTDAMTVILRQRGLNFVPGEEWSYSNSGYVLLKEIVARASGTSFAEFTRLRLFEPLEMKATAYRADMREVVKNRAMAYEKTRDGWQVAMLLDNDRGGGGLLSTAGDLLVWNEALANGRLGAFVTAGLQETAQLNNGRKLSYARGLIVGAYRGSPEVWHSGGAAGYNAWLGRYPEQGLSIALMCNRDVNGTGLAHQIVDLLAPPAGAPASAEPGAGAAGADPGGRAGLFIGGSGELLRLGVDRGLLRIAGGPPLMAVDETRYRPPRGDLFYRSQDEFELRFLSPDDIELRSMEGATTRYRRAAPVTLSAAELQAFAGRYESAELGAAFEVAPAEGGLAMRLTHAPGNVLTFRPIERDAFQFSQVTVRFRRDASGKVVGLDYGNPVIRKVAMTRIG